MGYWFARPHSERFSISVSLKHSRNLLTKSKILFCVLLERINSNWPDYFLRKISIGSWNKKIGSLTIRLNLLLRTADKRGDLVWMVWRCFSMLLKFAVFSWSHRNFCPFFFFMFWCFCFVSLVLNFKVKEKLCVVSSEFWFGLAWNRNFLSFFWYRDVLEFYILQKS